MISKKVKKQITYFLAGVVVIISTFGLGTWFPNHWITDKWTAKMQKAFANEWSEFGFLEPAIDYTTDEQFVKGVARCVDFWNLGIEPRERIHRDIIIAMAVLETGYGKSRFARDGNNLFGIRTWDPNVPQLKPFDLPDADFGVKKYRSKCASVKDMIRIINTHPAYTEFRAERVKQFNDHNFDIDKQIDFLNKWSTNPDYTTLVKDRAKKIHIYLDGQQNEN